MILSRACRFLIVALCVLATIYLALITFTNPSVQLISALTIELACMFIFFWTKFFNSKRKSQKQKKIVLEVIVEKSNLLTRLNTIFNTAGCTVLSVILILMTIDCIGLCSALNGDFKLAKIAYIASPTYKLDDCHPALSLEMYSGACIEAGKFKEAHKYTNFLLDLRAAVYGKNDWHYGGMLGNLAGLYYKEGNIEKAKETYEQSIDVCMKADGNKHLGSAYTRLGNCHRTMKEWIEAEKCYTKALTMRIDEYGEHSTRVAETILEMAHLAKLQNNEPDYSKLKKRAEKILASQHKKGNSDVLGLILIFVGSFFTHKLLFAKRGLLTNLAIKRLEKEIESQGEQANPEDLKRLLQLKI